MYKNILIPTDGSELSAKAVRSGVELAKSLGAKVTGLHVIVDAPVAAGIGKTMREPGEPAAAAEAHLETVAAEAKRMGVPYQCFHLKADTPHEGILGAATARKCDLIVMASHGKGAVASLLLGNETVQVLTHSKIPVLVCR